MKQKIIIHIIAAFFAALIFSAAALAQHEGRGGKTQVMVLGVYHFTNPNADQVKSNFPDHLSDKKQKEIAEVLDLLAEFRPTRIVVEAVPENERVRNGYLEYLKENYQLGGNEIEQIGYRLAKRFGHKQIYLADHQAGLDFSPVFAAANAAGNKQFLGNFQKVIGEIQQMQKRQEKVSVLEALIELNEPDFQEKTKNFYLQLTRAKSAGGFEGADALTKWYQRNFRIVSNVLQAVEKPDDRLLVIFGQGHAPYLREALASFPDMELIEPNKYLKK